FYMLMVLGIFWLIGGVLTLPGIAALVLGIGMAVDSCVVTFERVKEELKSGKSLINAFISGNKLSFSTIFDANVTTLIVAIVLFVFGESSVKGFATMLIITIMATMFIMVFINRIVLSKFVKTKYFEDKANFFVKYKSKKKKDRKIDSIGLLKKCLISTSLFLIIGLIYVGISGLNLGIDFKSGSDVSIKAPKAITIEMVKMDFKKLGYNIEEINNLDTNNVYVKLSNEFKEKDINKVNKYFENKYEATTEIGVVTNIVKQELIKNAMYSVLFAAIAIIIYISFRFKFSYAMSSILALFHDVLFVIIMFSVFKIEVNVIFIAAILTIVGYSINNTIVVFDRIRENINSHKNNKKMSNEELKVIINNSVSETVTRAIYTTVTTLIPVLCLIVLGSKEILPFNLALIFGLAAGTFSSVLLAGQVLYLFEKDKSKKIR
ncbi:MAG: protein translocase subunit SecF, partial [Bacilli bacterium]